MWASVWILLQGHTQLFLFELLSQTARF